MTAAESERIWRWTIAGLATLVIVVLTMTAVLA